MITGRDEVWIGQQHEARIIAMTPPLPRAKGEDWLLRYKARGQKGPCVYELIPVKHCQVCGAIGRELQPGQNRCRKHASRNPCAIEGCSRTTAAPKSGRLSCDDFFCGPHWRSLIPAGSAERRIYNRFFRRWKRFGETDESIRAFWRVWNRMVSRARARGRGDLDVAEINRVMGW